MFKKGNKLWDNPNAKKNWFKKGEHPSPKTEFKKGNIPWIKGKFKKDKTIIVPCVCGCGQLRFKYDKLGRERKYINGHCNKELLMSEKVIEKSRLKRLGQKMKPFTKKHIEKIKKARAKQILPVKDTKIEVKIQNFLKQLEIEFFTHQKMNIKHNYQCDILIPSMNLIIECDGDFIHCNPIRYSLDFVRYPNSKSNQPAYVIWEKDKIRTNELIEKGFKVLRLWEFEIKEMSIDKFKEKLESFK